MLGEMKNYILIFAGILTGLLVQSCDVHQFPDPSLKEVDFTLHLDYSTEMPLYKVVEYSEPTRAGEADDVYDVRYIVNVFDKDEASREVLHSFVFTKDGISHLENSVTFRIRVGEYRFVVWTDYVEQGSTADLFYATDKFEYIGFATEEHVGNEDMRDAFTGSLTAVVSDESLEGRVAMSRPLAKFNFVSDDVQDFVLRMMETKGSDDVEGCTVVFKYNGFMPSAYNLHSCGTTDSGAGYQFSSRIHKLDENEAELGFVIGSPFWRNGYAYEVCSHLLHLGKTVFEFDKIQALADKENTASVSLLAKLGFCYAEDVTVDEKEYQRYLYG